MSSKAYKISLSFNQVLELVHQLPKKDKARLSKELTKDILDLKLTGLLASFQTNEISEEEIIEEVEKVRAEIYAKKENPGNH